MSGSQGNRKIAQQEMLVGRTLQQGEYIIEAVLGHGGMGQVFLAAHAQVDVPVAIKQVRADEPLPPEVIEELDQLLHSKGRSTQPTQGDFPLSGGANTDRFLREALLLARLRHPAIPLLYDYFLENGYWYLVMEYVPGTTLSAYMREHSPLPPLEAVNYTLQICDVLDYLHRQNPPVVFRDLKPANIIMHPDGRLMIIDFGISRYFKEGQFNDTTDFGSPGYASPEQYEGAGQTDARSDLFSLGIIMHEMLSGQRPTRRGVNMEQLESLNKLNTAISPALGGLVMVATRTEPMYRFQSAHTFYQALERVRSVEERRTYRYQTLLAEITASQKTPVFPALLPLPSSQGFLSSEAAHEQDQRAQHMRMREQLPRNTARENLEQEALAHQLVSIDESLKQRVITSTLTRSAPQPVVLPVFDLNTIEVAVELPSESVPPPLLPPTPQDPLPPTPHLPGPRKRRWLRLVLTLFIVLLLISGSLLAYYYVVRTGHQRPIIPVKLDIPTQITMPTEPINVWRHLPSLPTQEADNTALYIVSQHAIYLTGGFRGAQATPLYSQGLYRYDIATAHWKKVAVANFPLMGNNAAAVDEHEEIFFSGGYSPALNTVSEHIYEYQPVNNVLKSIDVSPELPLGFGGSMLADRHGHLYFTEGFLLPGDPSTLAGLGWYRYDIASGLWHNLAALPVGLGYVQLALNADGNILMLGGSRDAGQLQPVRSIYQYDVQRDAWMQETTILPVPLSGSESCPDGHGNLVIAGGFDTVYQSSLSSVWLFHLAGLSMQPLGFLSGGSVLGTASCDGRGHVYLSRGANDPAKPTADFLELTLPKE